MRKGLSWGLCAWAVKAVPGTCATSGGKAGGGGGRWQNVSWVLKVGHFVTAPLVKRPITC